MSNTRCTDGTGSRTNVQRAAIIRHQHHEFKHDLSVSVAYCYLILSHVSAITAAAHWTLHTGRIRGQAIIKCPERRGFCPGYGRELVSVKT
eukprot:5037830-Pleurochrysis_carterae.AAC.1